MADPSTGRAIAKALRASLRLTSGSSKLLTLPQLYAVKDDLRGTLTLVEGEIRAAETGNPTRLVSNVSEVEDISDIDDNGLDGEKDNENAISGSECRNESPLTIPGPYPMNPPDMVELPDCWYVVDRGIEVGIFADNASSTRAVTGVTGGHQTKVKAWYEAATLYNALYHKGGIVRVRA